MGQLADKTHRVGEQEGQIAQHHLAHRGVQRGKELVLGKHLALAQQVHQRRLAHIGVSHQCHTHQCLAVLPLLHLLLVNILQLLFQQGNLLGNQSAVGLNLCLARPAHTDTTALPLKVCPHAGQTRQHILQLCQFHLCLGDTGTGALGEYIQNQRGAVQNPALKLAFQIAQLCRRQFIVEHQKVGI